MNKQNSNKNTKYNAYHFGKSNKFSKQNWSVIETTYKNFADLLSNKLTNYIKSPIEIKLLDVNQLKTYDWINSLHQTMIFSQFEFKETKEKSFLALNYDILNCVINRLLGGYGISEDINNNLSDIEKVLYKNIALQIIKAFEEVWNIDKELGYNYSSFENNVSLPEDAGLSEYLAVSNFEIKLNNNYGIMAIALPYRLAKSMLINLNSQILNKNKNLKSTNKDKEQIIHNLQTSNVDIKVILGKAEINLKQLINLKPGDILKLDNKISDTLTMEINNQNKFKVIPGTIRNRLSAKITEPYDEVDEILKGFI